MIRSRVFIVLAIALFLGGCLCAEATAPSAVVADEETAKAKVTELQGLTKGVLEKAETKLREAQSAKTAAGDEKSKAEMAESAVRTAGAEIKVGNRKTQADAVAKTTAEEWANCQRLYDAAIVKADQASNSLKAFVVRARTLDNEGKTKIVPASGQPDNYAQLIASAATATSDTQSLNGEIETSRVLIDAESALFQLKGSAQKIQVLKYQAESLVIVTRIEAKLKTSESDIHSIQQKKDEIDAIVKDMNNKLESASGTSTSVLSSLCSTAEGQLRTAKKKVTEANECKQAMLGQKPELDQDLKTLMDRTDEETNAGQEAGKVKWHAKNIDGEIAKIKAALGAADNALSSAKTVQKQMQDTIDKTSEQPVDTHLDKTEQTKSTQVTDNQTPNPKDDNSELLNNDKLRNITKDITNNPLIGGEVPTRSAANDSAVTVFIPLLVILVISAGLH